jgi:hypothetical protein
MQKIIPVSDSDGSSEGQRKSETMSEVAYEQQMENRSPFYDTIDYIQYILSYSNIKMAVKDFMENASLDFSISVLFIDVVFQLI